MLLCILQLQSNFCLTLCLYYNICIVVLSKQAFILYIFQFLAQFYEEDETNIISSILQKRILRLRRFKEVIYLKSHKIQVAESVFWWFQNVWGLGMGAGRACGYYHYSWYLKVMASVIEWFAQWWEWGEGRRGK